MKPVSILSLLFILALLILFITPYIGISVHTSAEIQQLILTQIRIPRVLLAFIAGSGLALCGLVYQAMFHNPLATPFTLGVASGASLGASLFIYSGLSFSFLGIDGITLFAFSGALLAILSVYALSRFQHSFSPETLLLAGVAISFFFSSLILFTQYLSNINDAFQILHWLMGSLITVAYKDIFQLFPFVVISMIVVIRFYQELNLLMAGDEIALSRGVAVQRIRYLLFFITSLCISAIVALCGPIGFIGMMVPHICRLIIGYNHQWLIPATLLFGGCFLVVCDTIARLVFSPTEIPVGVITNLLGGPFFLWLLIKSRTRSC